jgi:hypothetical protein
MKPTGTGRLLTIIWMTVLALWSVETTSLLCPPVLADKFTGDVLTNEHQ